MKRSVYNMRCQMEYRNHVIRCQIQFFSYVKLKSLIIKEIKANILLIFVIYYLGHILHRGFYIEILFFYKNLCQTLDVKKDYAPSWIYFIIVTTVCPRSLDPFYIVTYYIKDCLDKQYSNMLPSKTSSFIVTEKIFIIKSLYVIIWLNLILILMLQYKKLCLS